MVNSFVVEKILPTYHVFDVSFLRDWLPLIYSAWVIVWLLASTFWSSGLFLAPDTGFCLVIMGPVMFSPEFVWWDRGMWCLFYNRYKMWVPPIQRIVLKSWVIFVVPRLNSSWAVPSGSYNCSNKANVVRSICASCDEFSKYVFMFSLFLLFFDILMIFVHPVLIF